MTADPHTPLNAGRVAAPPPGCPAHSGAVPFGGPRFHTDPAALYRELRSGHGPVVPVTLTGGVPAWLVIGYHELEQVTTDPDLYSRDSRLWNQWRRLPPDWRLPPRLEWRQTSVVGETGDRHQRRAAMISAALSGTDPRTLGHHAETLADRLIDDFCAADHADLMSRYALHLPIRVLTRIFGFPDEDGPDLARALNHRTAAGAAAPAARRQLTDAMSRLVAARHAKPAPDVVSRMLAHEPREFSDDEIVEDLLVLADGHQAAADWIGGTVRLLLTDERFTGSPDGGRHGVADAMAEVLWTDTPNQNVTGRWTTRETRLGDRRLAAGDLVLLGLAAANDDPDGQYGDTGPAGFHAGRNAHFAFSHGVHRCPFAAQEIAEVIVRTGVEVLLDRIPDLALAVPPDSLTYDRSPWRRSLSALPVRFSPGPAVGPVAPG